MLVTSAAWQPSSMDDAADGAAAAALVKFAGQEADEEVQNCPGPRQRPEAFEIIEGRAWLYRLGKANKEVDPRFNTLIGLGQRLGARDLADNVVRADQHGVPLGEEYATSRATHRDTRRRGIRRGGVDDVGEHRAGGDLGAEFLAIGNHARRWGAHEFHAAERHWFPPRKRQQAPASPSMTPARCRWRNSPAASSDASASLTEATPRSSRVALRQTCGIRNCGAKRRASSCQGRLHVVSNSGGASAMNTQSGCMSNQSPGGNQTRGR